MPEFITVLRQEEISEMVKAMGRQISSDYKGRRLVLIGILKGAFIFLADLVRQITIPLEVDFIRAASYGSGTSSSGSVRLTKEVELDLFGKDVLLVEDIVDTGLTLDYIIEYLRKSGPATVKICSFIDKRERRQTSVPIDYACHVVEEGFLVGYGLDHAEDYRHLPEIYHLKL